MQIPGMAANWQNLKWMIVWFVLGIYLPRELNLIYGDAAWELMVMLNVIGLLILFYKVEGP